MILAKRGATLLVIGDSTVWTATTKGDDLCYHKVARYISKNKAPVELINKGIGGATTVKALSNLLWAMSTPADCVMICFGMNDCLSANSISTALFKTNLAILIDNARARNSDADIILCAPNTTTDANRSTIATYRTAMSEVAAAKNTKYVDFSAAWASGSMGTYSADTIHPNSAGHALMYDLLLPVVLQGNWVGRVGK